MSDETYEWVMNQPSMAADRIEKLQGSIEALREMVKVQERMIGDLQSEHRRERNRAAALRKRLMSVQCCSPLDCSYDEPCHNCAIKDALAEDASK